VHTGIYAEERKNMEFLRRKFVILGWKGAMRLLWVSEIELRGLILMIKEGNFDFENDLFGLRERLEWRKRGRQW
jgi:hypothetical protein